MRSMKILTMSMAVVCSALFTACGTSKTYSDGYRPSIIDNRVDRHQYEQDRSHCERRVKESPSNLESTNNIRFRECLLRQGYQLLS